MNKYLKKEEGSVLVMVIIIMFVVTIIGTALLRVAVAENTFTHKQEDKLQAYYIARSGAQSLAEYLIKGEYDESIIGETSEPYDISNGTLEVSLEYRDSDNEDIVLESDELDEDKDRIIYVTANGEYKNINQTVRIRVVETDGGLGALDHALFALDGIGPDKSINGIEIDGSIATNGTITVTNIDDDKKITITDGYIENQSFTLWTIDTPDSYDVELEMTDKNSYHWNGDPASKGDFYFSFNGEDSSDGDDTYNVNVTKIDKVNSINIEGNGVVNIFYTGTEEDVILKGDVNISKDAQLHIYITEEVSFSYQGDPLIEGGAIFIYGPDATISLESATHLEFRGIIIGKEIILANQFKITEAPEIIDYISGFNTENVGVIYRGYSWIE